MSTSSPSTSLMSPPSTTHAPKPFSLSGSSSSTSGPNFPSTWTGSGSSSGVRTSLAHHSRRPSRAERYEALVEGARDLLKRAEEEDHQDGRVGLGFEPEAFGVKQGEWRDTVESLLKVVDGMSRQLATHDELAAQLKIAQSNLTLAETHSEYLEEELRRRESRHSVSSAIASTSMNHHHAPHRANTISHTGEGRPESGTSLFGGLVNLPGNVVRGGRKQTPSVGSNTSMQSGTATTGVSTAPTSTIVAPNHHYPHRSSSSSPRLGDAETRSSLSNDGHHHHHHPQQHLSSDVFTLQSQVSSLEQALSSLRVTNTGLRKAHDGLASKCAGLEKTKDDLLAELESLSVELFQEANTMVASERKLRAKAEDEVERIRAEVDRLTRQIEEIRISGDRRVSIASGKTIVSGGGCGGNPPPIPSAPRPYQDGSAHPRSILTPLVTDSTTSSSGLNLATDSPSTESATSKSSKWFNFGRNPNNGKKSRSDSEEYAAESSSGTGLAPPDSAPGMIRGGSSNSVLSVSSVASSFFSADDHPHAPQSPAIGQDTSVEHLVDSEASRRAGARPLRKDSPLLGVDVARANDRSRGSPQISLSSPDSAALLSASSSPALGTSRSPRPMHELVARERGAGAGAVGTTLTKPIAIYSFEGESTAKSPRSPNEMRWKDAVKEITSPTLGSSPLGSLPPMTVPSITAVADVRKEEDRGSKKGPRISQIPLSAPSPPRSNGSDSNATGASPTTGVKRSPGSLRLDTAARSQSPSPASFNSSASTMITGATEGGRGGPRSSLPYRSRSTDPRLSSASDASSPTNLNAPSTRPLRPEFSRSNSHQASYTASASSQSFNFGELPESTSTSSLASSSHHRTAEELDSLMRNIADMASLFGAEAEEFGLETVAVDDDPTKGRATAAEGGGGSGRKGGTVGARVGE